MIFESERTKAIKEGILEATSSMARIISTSFGPQGLDKMIKKGKDCTITNDGATILKFFKAHPIHNILSSISDTQDINCGDGTTSVVLLTCLLYEKLSIESIENIFAKIEALDIAKKIAIEHIDKVKIPANDTMNAALTALNSKIAFKNIHMAQVAIEALSKFNMNDIKIIKRHTNQMNSIILHHGMVFKFQKGYIADNLNGIVKMQIIQFCISNHKTNMDSKINIKNYQQVENFVQEEKEYLIRIIRKIKDTGTNLIFVQKSLTRESISTLALHLLKKAGISVIDSVDRKDIAYLCEKLNIQPISDIDLLSTPVEINVKVLCDKKDNFTNLTDDAIITNKYIELQVKNSCTIAVSGVDDVIIEENIRCLNDVLSVIKCLLDNPFIVPGGCAIETGIGIKLEDYSGPHKLIIDKIAEAFFTMPYYISKNAGYQSMEIINKLKKKLKENWNLGISIRKNTISDMINEDNIIQPAVINKNIVILAIETVQMLLKIDDILPTITIKHE